MIDPRQIKKAGGVQLKFPANELTRLKHRIEEDYNAAISDHEERMRRFQQYYLRWRGRTEPVGTRTPLFRVPVTQWHVYSKWAKEQASLFGADAQVVAKPVGPNDQRQTRKIERFENWRLFSSMKIQNPAAIFNFRKILFGRSHAYAPWVRDTYQVPLQDGGQTELVSFEGPAFYPLWPDDLIVPAEDVETIHDFSFVLRKYRATPNDLLRGDGGLYQGIRQNFDSIVQHSMNRRTRDDRDDRVKQVKDAAEGVLYEGNLSAGNCLTIHEWYGRWRKLKGKQDAREDNLERRETYESDIVVRYIPDMQLIVGIQDLADLYPAKKDRRPFVESALVRDGSYWCPSFGELLERIESELSENHNLASKAGKLSVGPVIFYSPASGFDPDTFEYEPGMAVAIDDPNQVKPVQLNADLQYPIVKEQTVLGYGERVTGVTDMNMGRSSDRPNAPKTARATLALLEEGDVRASLDMSVLREDWGAIISHFWSLECMYAPKSLFFRVAEDDADGLPLERGGTTLTEEDRTGSYDFDLKFATNVWSREQQKQDKLALYQLDLQNPLVINNPRALWKVLDGVHKAFGDDRFMDLVPEPPDMGLPVNSKEEWTRLLQGEDITVNPLDNDELHIMDHNRRLQDAQRNPNLDENAYNAMVAHVLEHTDQLQQKKLMAELVDRLSQNVGAVSAMNQMIAPMQEEARQEMPKAA
jgi:hypothetical protein